MEHKTTTKGIILYTALAALIALVSFVVFRFWIPQHYFALYPLIPAYFYVAGILQFLIVERARERKTHSWSSVYIPAKTIKLLIALVLVFIYCFLHREIAVKVLISTGIVYLLVLAFETWFYYSYGKKKA